MDTVWRSLRDALAHSWTGVSLSIDSLTLAAADLAVRQHCERHRRSRIGITDRPNVERKGLNCLEPVRARWMRCRNEGELRSVPMQQNALAIVSEARSPHVAA